MNNENCNQAVGGDCNDGFYGAHCEQDIVVCDVFSNGLPKFYCFSQGSTGCSSKKSCKCNDGYTGKHCSRYVGFDDSESDGQDTEMIIAMSVLLIVCLSASLALFIMYRREKQGNSLISVANSPARRHDGQEKHLNSPTLNMPARISSLRYAEIKFWFVVFVFL